MYEYHFKFLIQLEEFSFLLCSYQIKWIFMNLNNPIWWFELFTIIGLSIFWFINEYKFILLYFHLIFERYTNFSKISVGHQGHSKINNYLYTTSYLFSNLMFWWGCQFLYHSFFIIIRQIPYSLLMVFGIGFGK